MQSRFRAPTRMFWIRWKVLDIILMKGFGSSKLRLNVLGYRAALAIMRLQRIFEPYVLAALRSIKIDEGGNGDEGHQSLQYTLVDPQ